MEQRREGTTYFDYYLKNKHSNETLDNKQNESPVIISPTDIKNIKSHQRNWKITSMHLGYLERIARVHYEVGKITGVEYDKWIKSSQNNNFDDPTTYYEPIASSVYASSEIEGEAIHIKDMKLALVGDPMEDDAEHKDEYSQRRKCVRAIYNTYLYAIFKKKFPLEGGDVLNPDFIQDLHRRMFSEVKPETAGKIKTKITQITRDDKPVLITLPPDKTPEYLDEICKTLTEKFRLADDAGIYSKIIAIAEFIVDFLAIHPFLDGNGRTARLLSTFLLEKANFHFARFDSLDKIILERRSDYYDALNTSQKNWGTVDEDLTPWIQFYIKAIYTQYTNTRQRIIERFAQE